MRDKMIKKEEDEMMPIQLPNGQMVNGVEVDYEIKSEPWMEITTSDGSTIRMRIQIKRIIRIDQYDQMTGTPSYIIMSDNAMRVHSPKNLKKFIKPQTTNSSGVEFA